MIRITTICAGCDTTISVVFKAEESTRKLSAHTQYLMCDACRGTLSHGMVLPPLQLCPHGMPVETQCTGCLATVGGNHGA